MKKFKYLLFILLLLILLPLLSNKIIKTNFQDLSSREKALLQDYENFYQKNPQLWNKYDLSQKTLVLVDKNAFGPLYIINPSENFLSPWAQKITLPKNFQSRVFRVARSHPGRFQFILGNFNETGKDYSLLGQKDLFYVKAQKDSLASKYKSTRFIPFLAHEAFHYYIQEGWKSLSFRGLSYSQEELQLLDKEYQVLDKLQSQVEKTTPDPILIKSLLKDYLAVMDQRVQHTNSEKLKAELQEETIEGTAQYVGIRAAQATNYDLGILYFDNTKDVRFSDILPALQAGKIDQSLIGSHLVYESGALLCFALDKIDFPSWQETLVEKNKSGPYTLYDLIKDHSQS